MITMLIIASSLVGMLVSFAWFPTVQIKGKWTFAPYWIAVSLGAFLLWMNSGWSLRFLEEAWLSQGAINPIRILSLFLSFSFLSIALDEAGFIQYVAMVVLRLAKGSGFGLFFLWYVLVSCLTIFTANDIVILTLTPFIIYLTRALKIHVLPYVVSLFVAANTWSMLFIVGNPTNLYLALSFDISFQSYVSVMFFPTVFSSIIGFLIMLVIFRKDLQLTAPSSIKNTLPNVDFLTSRLALFFLIITLVYMVFASWFPYPMDLIIVMNTLLFIGISFILKRKAIMTSTWFRLPFSMIPFFLSMAIFVYAFDAVGFTETMQDFLGRVAVPYGEGFFSVFIALFMNNIPMSVWFSDILTTVQPDGLVAIYQVIVASNLAALFTPFGALAGLMFFDILRRFQVPYSFKSFITYGWIIGLPMLITAFIIIDLIL
jgi:arsenical pump membrane protein